MMKRLVLSHHAHLFLCDFILNTELTVLPIIIVHNYYYYNYVLYDLVPLYLIPIMNNFSHLIIQRCLWNTMLNSYNVNDPIFSPPFSQCLLLGWSVQQWPGITLLHETWESCRCEKETLSKSTARLVETRAGGKERPTDEWVNHESLLFYGC